LLVVGVGLVFLLTRGKGNPRSTEETGREVASGKATDGAETQGRSVGVGVPLDGTVGMTNVPSDATSSDGSHNRVTGLASAPDAGVQQGAGGRKPARSVRERPSRGGQASVSMSRRPVRVTLIKGPRSPGAAGRDRSAVRAAPRKVDARALFKAARSALLAGRYGESGRLIRRLSSMPGMGGRAKALQAEMAFQQGRYKSAARLASRAVHAGGGTRARLTLANAYYRLGLYKSAAAAYKDVLHRWPHSRAASAGLRATKRHLK